MCKRCGGQISQSVLRISYPSTAKCNTSAVTALLHVDCAVKEFKILQQIAEQGHDKDYVEEHLVGFEALRRSEREKLLHSLQNPVATPPQQLPESQVHQAQATLVQHATPEKLQAPLKPFQQEGLSWLLQREGEVESESHVLHGGILADEMGMGKTRQIIALILASSAAGATLVVVPPTCLAQWREELTEVVMPDTLEVFKYQGPNRSLPDRFTGKAVVLTTYRTLEVEFRKQQVEERPCKRRRLDDLWDDQVQHDLSNSPLFAKRWARIVLDEAHRIKSVRGSTAQAAFNLRGKRRWCLSGTPMQNRIGEVASLVRFLRLHPYGFNRCRRRGCECECLFVKCTENTSLCENCGHKKSQHCSVFAKEISTPIRQFGFMGKGKTALESLRLDIFHKIMLRRPKSTLNLPKLSINVKKISLDPRESRAYARIKALDKQVLEELMAKGNLLQNFAHIFSIIMRRRQAANHPQLAKFGLDSRCLFCQNEVDEMDEATEVFPCERHAAHEVCYVEYMREAPEDASVICPFCELAPHEPLGGSSIVEGLQKADRPIRRSTKIDTLIKEIQESLSDGSPSEPDKFLVFSSFAHFLELCSYFLDEADITHSLISGKTTMKDRNQIIKQFREDADMRVLLISLQVGGEGLNLQVANRVFLLDPWWNPAMEQQAYQRAHRVLDQASFHRQF